MPSSYDCNIFVRIVRCLGETGQEKRKPSFAWPLEMFGQRLLLELSIPERLTAYSAHAKTG